jgi:aryl-alcohol dehydrogenase-like predicted oxidoreductase
LNKLILGNSDLSVSRLGLGCMGMSEFYGPSDEADCVQTLHAALGLGINFYDTADMYGRGNNEVLLAKAFAERWHDIVLATKFGVVRTEDGGFAGICGKPDYVKSACEQSLRRLSRDHIDLYYAHRVDPDVPVEETVGAMKELVEAGKVRYIGLSEATANQLRRAHGVYPITALQSEYSLWSRDPEGEILDTCRELGIGFVAYSPLGRGFLTGAIISRDSLAEGDGRLGFARFQEQALEKNKIYLEIIAGIAKEKHITPAQVALAWVLNQGEDIVPIPGTRSIDRLKENAAAVEIHFTATELADIRSSLPETFGGRYQ